MKKALVVLADGFEDIEAVSIVDVLRRGGVEVVTASLAQTPVVRSAHGIAMTADAMFAEAADGVFDALVLPGGGEGTANLMASQELFERLRRQKAEGGLVCAICAAPTVLEAAGVIEDEEVTCYPSCAVDMERPVSDVPVVVAGQLVTGRGPGQAVLFGLVVLSCLTDERTAHRVANGMLVKFE